MYILDSLANPTLLSSSSPLFWSYLVLLLPSKNPTSFIFYLHFSGFTYKLFFASLFITFSTTLSCFFSPSVPTIIFLMRLATSSVLIKSYRISFIIVYNVVRKLVSSKNITTNSKDSSGVINTAFYSSPFFTHTLL